MRVSLQGNFWFSSLSKQNYTFFKTSLSQSAYHVLSWKHITFLFTICAKGATIFPVHHILSPQKWFSVLWQNLHSFIFLFKLNSNFCMNPAVWWIDQNKEYNNAPKAQNIFAIGWSSSIISINLIFQMLCKGFANLHTKRLTFKLYFQ